MSRPPRQTPELQETAQRRADQIEREVGERHQILKREARMLEERRQRVLESLRDGGSTPGCLVEPTEKAPRDEALVDALSVDRQRQESPRLMQSSLTT